MISIIGAGLMGRSLSVELARFGYQIDLITKDNSEKLITLKENITKLCVKYYPEQVAEITSRIQIRYDYQNLSKSELVIESITENLDLKRELLKNIEEFLLPNTLVASNTSSLSISKIFEGYSNPERYFGLHFFNPVQVMKLVEVSYTPFTSDETLNFAYKLVEKVEKESVTVKDSTGFIVNRLLIPMINEASKLVDEGIASIEDIDKAMKLGANHPIGPFKLSDLIGNDVTVSILEELFADKEIEKHEIALTLQDLVKENKLGRKSSSGFYIYNK